MVAQALNYLMTHITAVNETGLLTGYHAGIVLYVKLLCLATGSRVTWSVTMPSPLPVRYGRFDELQYGDAFIPLSAFWPGHPVKCDETVSFICN